jgi:hypothetical protein
MNTTSNLRLPAMAGITLAAVLIIAFALDFAIMATKPDNAAAPASLAPRGS